MQVQQRCWYVLCFAILFGTVAETAAQESLTVIAAEARRAPFEELYRGLGTVRADESATITAEVTGIIERLAFDDAQQVEEGDLLAQLQDDEEQAQLNVETAELREQEREYERVQNLVKSKALPSSQLDTRLSLLEEAQARVKLAKARIALMKVRAPFDGVLGLRNVSVGQLISPGTAIVTLDKLDFVKVDFEVPEVYLAQLQPGLPVTATSKSFPGQRFDGEVTSVDTRVNPATRSIIVRTRLPNPDLHLRPGMLLEVGLVKERQEATIIPEGALIPEGNEQYVYLLNGTPEEATIERRKVIIGQRRPGEVEILEGLQPGDRVITEGTMRVRPGGTVQYTLDAPDYLENQAQQGTKS